MSLPNFSDDSSDSIYRRGSEKEIASAAPQGLVKEAKLVTTQGNVITKDGVAISTQESDASLATNIFQDPEVKAYYLDVYEKAKYECRHVFDADITWSKEEERKLVRKLDLRGTL
jgi:hypothetical protein